jgi:peroxiredoxin family protein
MAASPLPPLAVFLHSGEYDRMHQGFAIAAAAAASGRTVHLVFTWWALERLLDGRLDAPDFPARQDVEERFESRALPTLRELLSHAQETGHCRTWGCTGSLAALGRTPAEAEGKVEQLAGWSTLLLATTGITDRFYV